MKNLFIISLSMIAMICFSCNRNQTDEICECDENSRPYPFVSSINVEVPVKTAFEDGVFKIDCEIVSDEESDAFILLALRHIYDVNDPSYSHGYIKGFGNEVKVDDYQIRSYHQLYFDSDKIYSQTMDFPVFMKKIKVPNGSIRERINIHLPDGFTESWGEIVVFRSSKAIEESMKTKIDIEMHKKTYYKNINMVYYPFAEGKIDAYHKFFPDSSLFSFLITSYRDLAVGYCENVGEKLTQEDSGELSLRPSMGFSYPPSRFDSDQPYCIFFGL